MISWCAIELKQVGRNVSKWWGEDETGSKKNKIKNTCVLSSFVKQKLFECASEWVGKCAHFFYFAFFGAHIHDVFLCYHVMLRKLSGFGGMCQVNCFSFFWVEKCKSGSET